MSEELEGFINLARIILALLLIAAVFLGAPNWITITLVVLVAAGLVWSLVNTLKGR